MMKVTLLTFLFGAALANPVPSDISGRVVGGETAAVGKWPGIISLRTASNSHTCGGSLISPSWVITAGHCVIGVNPSSYSVIAGINKLNSTTGVRVGISQITVHPGYDDYYLINDIALLRLSTPIQESSLIKITKLETSNVDSARAADLVGWGRTSYPGNIPNDLQELRVRTITHQQCASSWPYEDIQQSQICTFTQAGQGACHGDSGGPLIDAATGALIGLVSWGAPCAVGAPDVFTRVSSFTGFIEQTTGLSLS